MKVLHSFQDLGSWSERDVVTQMLRLGNKSNNPIAFKVCELARLFSKAIRLTLWELGQDDGAEAILCSAQLRQAYAFLIEGATHD